MKTNISSIHKIIGTDTIYIKIFNKRVLSRNQRLPTMPLLNPVVSNIYWTIIDGVYDIFGLYLNMNKV